MPAATFSEDQVKAELLRSLPSGRAVVANWEAVGRELPPAGDSGPPRPARPRRIVFAAEGPSEAEVKAEIARSLPSAAGILNNWAKVKPGA